MTVAALLIRALAVALLLGSVALPTADHHAGSRLPEVGLVGPVIDARGLATHHHSTADDQSLPQAGPAFLPGVVPEISGMPIHPLVFASLAYRPPVARGDIVESRQIRRPVGASRAPPTPPPKSIL